LSCGASFLSKTFLTTLQYLVFSSYIESIDVRVLVNSLYIVLASTIGLWFSKSVGSPFLYSIIVKLVFHDYGMVQCYYGMFYNGMPSRLQIVNSV
jgi:hypothetical protein